MGFNKVPVRPSTRDAVYDVIDGERDYQDVRNLPVPTLAAWVDLIDDYAMKMTNPSQTVDDRAILKRLRQIAALAVAAMEAHGCAPREHHVPASAGITGTMHLVSGPDSFSPRPTGPGTLVPIPQRGMPGSTLCALPYNVSDDVTRFNVANITGTAVVPLDAFKTVAVGSQLPPPQQQDAKNR